MQFTQKSLSKFKRLFWEHFGVELTDEEAERRAEYLLGIFKVIYRAPDVSKFFDNKIQNEE